MKDKKIIRLPKMQLVGVSENTLDDGGCTLTLHPDWFALNLHQMLCILEQTFIAGAKSKETKNKKIISSFMKYLKTIE